MLFAMIITTGNDLAGYEITAYLGVVRGIIVRSTGTAPGFIGRLRSLGAGQPSVSGEAAMGLGISVHTGAVPRRASVRCSTALRFVARRNLTPARGIESQ